MAKSRDAAVILTAVAVTLHWHCGNAVSRPDILSQCQTVGNLRLEGGVGPIDGFVVSKFGGKWSRFCFMSTFNISSNFVNVLQNLKVICRETGRRSDDVSIVANNLFVLDSLRRNYSSAVSSKGLACSGTEPSVDFCQPLGQGVKQSNPELTYSDQCWFGVACGKDPSFSISLQRARVIGPATEDQLINGNTAIDMVVVEAFGMTGLVCTAPRRMKEAAAAAKVVCRQNGYRTSVGYHLLMVAVNGSSCLMHNVKCMGTERTLQECKHANIWTSSNLRPDALLGFGTTSWPLFVQCSNRTTELGIFHHSHDHVRPENPQPIFIRHNGFFLPILNDSTTETCRAVCAHMYRGRNFTAVCVDRYLTSIAPKNQSDDGEYYATLAALDCSFGNETLDDCIYGIEERMGLDIYSFQTTHLMASCAPMISERQGLPAGSSVYFSRISTRVGQGGENATEDDSIEVDIATELVQVKFKGQKYWLLSSGTTENERVAWIICKHMYPKKSLANVMWSADESQLNYQAYINCPEGATSANACSYYFTTAIGNSALRVRCVYSDELFRLNLTKGFGKSDGAVQLSTGHVTVYMDTNNWTDQTAAVSCRHLGLSFTLARAIAKYISVDHSGVWLLRLSCNGSESLVTDCAQSYRYIKPQRLGSLGYSYVGGAVCNGEKFSVTFLEPQILERRSSNAVTPAIQHDEGLILICINLFEFHTESNPEKIGLLTLCKNGGFRQTSVAYAVNTKRSATENLSSHSAVSRLSCGSGDASIETCSYELMMPADACNDLAWLVEVGIGVILCEDRPIGGKLRLAGGATPFEGHLEMLYNGAWMAVCDDRFTDFSATLVCREIFGSGSDGKAVLGSSFAVSNTKYLLDDVECDPALHRRLKDCISNNFQPGRHNCNACEQAGVTCTRVSYIGDPTLTLNIIDDRLILTCSADGDPSPTYQWFVNGSLASVDRRLVISSSSNSTENVFYVCTVYNSAGESSVEIELGSVACPVQPNISSQFTQPGETAAVTGTSAFLGILSIAFVALILNALLLRRRLAMFESSSNVIPKVAYSNPYFNLDLVQQSAS